MVNKRIIRTPLSPEQIEDAKRLKALYSATPHGLSQAEFGQRHEIGSQGMVWQYLNGHTALNAKAAKSFAVGLGCNVSDFSPSLAQEIEHLAEGVAQADPDEFAQVRRVDVSVSAGRGVLVVEEHSKSALTFRRSFLQEVGVTPHSAVIVTVKGHSMDPTLRDGAVLLVNTSAKTVANGQIYAFRSDGELFVKRLHRTKEGDLLAVSDNPDRDQYPDITIPAYDQDFEIIGRALWMGAKL